MPLHSKDMERNPDKIHFFRLTYPQHFNTKTAYPHAGNFWLGAQSGEVVPSCVEFSLRLNTDWHNAN